MLLTRRQISTVLATAEIDGVARRLVLCPPGLPVAHVKAVMLDAQVDALVVDNDLSEDLCPHGVELFLCTGNIVATSSTARRTVETEWVLLTSGTTGPPKAAVHTLASLTASIGDGLSPGSPVWSTFYDIRRYGGLQILLRALLGGGALVLSDAEEAVDRFLTRLGARGVTHISGTPSQWRVALLSAAAASIAPSYVRLSGEASDQTILDRLRLAYPRAAVAHAFASTEAGVAFDVRDGLAGFPAWLIGPDHAGVQLRIEAGSLRIRSPGAARHYLGDNHHSFPRDGEDFVDTGDLVELRNGRYHFIGRRGGVINVGGLKVHPEAVEVVINEHPAVQTSRVSGRHSPITGAIVVAEIVMRRMMASETTEDFSSVQHEVRALCQRRLSPYQVPTMFHEVASLELAPSGKISRRHA